MYDNTRERFFDEMNRGSWAVLAGANYPGTRLAGVPLSPKSQIDYIIATLVQGSERGLLERRLLNPKPKVHHAHRQVDHIGPPSLEVALGGTTEIGQQRLRETVQRLEALGRELAPDSTETLAGDNGTTYSRYPLYPQKFTLRLIAARKVPTCFPN